ncbi:MAG TPA: S41 family peptidase [Candidatus Eisenbacteria bacterium]|uniref:S41 family peptidase n=1 Tax=Eiseniibacteriota bacterium TaxID=2212470 RepID=A0A7V2AUL3_UNCEI|nr:S41 family peptidase [Candidatus Eisenbacteria bacterium]
MWRSILRFDKKLVITLVLVFTVTAVAILVWAQDQRRQNTAKVLEDLKPFAEVYERIVDFYVTEVDTEELIEAAIEAMLEELDSHSIYLSKHEWENLMIDTKGEFGGLGITLAIRDGFPTVISPIEDTPAYRLGIQGGDLIVQIEGESTKGWNSEQAVSKLRGPPGTHVDITVFREGLEDSLYFTVTREVIMVPSVPYTENLNGVGYIRVSRFAEKTAGELEEVIMGFERQGVEGLILDLRSNPGGLLESAREVSELFLGRDTLIVYTESRIPDGNQKFKSTARRVHDRFPIVVLVNGASASASEIVAGALQDWDKAVIVGQPTFGKGSVQTVFKIEGGSALKLTTMKYFTPAGRSIHKDDPEEEGEEAEAAPAEREEFRTATGRIVYGGGGIMPDWEIDLPEFTDLQRRLELRGTFFSFAIHYTAYHDVDETFEVTDDVFAEFVDFLAEKEIEVEEDEWTEENLDYARLGIKREVFRKLFGAKGAFIATLSSDEEINKVLEMFGKTASLEEMFEYAGERAKLARAAAGGE